MQQVLMQLKPQQQYFVRWVYQQCGFDLIRVYLVKGDPEFLHIEYINDINKVCKTAKISKYTPLVEVKER